MLRASLLQNGETELTSTSTDKIPEDFWSPAIEVPDGIEYQDVYGPISPVPNHDGTECFRWDNTLWKKADHFRVGELVVLSLVCSVGALTLVEC